MTPTRLENIKWIQCIQSDDVIEGILPTTPKPPGFSTYIKTDDILTKEPEEGGCPYSLVKYGSSFKVPNSIAVISKTTPKDEILLATHDNLIYHYKSFKLIKIWDISHITKEQVSSLTQAEDGSIWVGACDFVCRLEDTLATLYDELSHGFFSRLGPITVTTWGDINIFASKYTNLNSTEGIANRICVASKSDCRVLKQYPYTIGKSCGKLVFLGKSRDGDTSYLSVSEWKGGLTFTNLGQLSLGKYYTDMLIHNELILVLRSHNFGATLLDINLNCILQIHSSISDSIQEFFIDSNTLYYTKEHWTSGDSTLANTPGCKALFRLEIAKKTITDYFMVKEHWGGVNLIVLPDVIMACTFSGPYIYRMMWSKTTHRLMSEEEKKRVINVIMSNRFSRISMPQDILNIVIEYAFSKQLQTTDLTNKCICTSPSQKL